MAIDIEREMAAAVAKRGERSGAILCEMNLLKRVLRSRSMTDFETFFEYFADRTFHLDMERYPSLLGAWWMSRFRPRHLLWIYDHMLMDYGALKQLGAFVTDDRIALPRRAFFYHAVFRVRAHVSSRCGGIFALPPFWWDNRRAWSEYVEIVRNDEPNAFIRRFGLPPRSAYKLSEALAAGMEKDSVPVFEMTRQLENRRLSDSMMNRLIALDSGKCFAYVLANHPEQVFKLRSPEEWLFTVCREAKDGLGAAAVDELERQLPGIVGRARDPWGNTPLWNTLFNARPTAELQARLLRLVCDPDAENRYGLSYRLLKDNDPEKLRRELGGA